MVRWPVAEALALPVELQRGDGDVVGAGGGGEQPLGFFQGDEEHVATRRLIKEHPNCCAEAFGYAAGEGTGFGQ